MTKDYQRCVVFWDNVFSKETDLFSSHITTENKNLDEALRWLCDGTQSVIDFGCGNGSMLFICAQNGTKVHLGIDLSNEAVLLSKRRANSFRVGSYTFLQGGVETLSNIPDASFDAMILSNIIDNLFPDDAITVISECARILRKNAKLLIKLNPYISATQIKDWNIKCISENLFDDGLILWNNTTDQWRALFEQHFKVIFTEEIYYPEHEQTNRMFCLIH